MGRLSLFLREYKDYNHIFAESNRRNRQLVFYSERDVYYQYFEGYVHHVLENSNLNIAYITSDPNDPIFRTENSRIHPYYINNFLAATLSHLDARALVMTMPDLGKYHIKKSPYTINHIYMFHGVGSTHLQYNKDAFNAYDTIFCIGKYDYDELRKAEQIYNLPKKTLVECGYYRIEKIYTSYQQMLDKNPTQNTNLKTILIAPSWHAENILAYCADELINILKNCGYSVIIRPHPEFIKRNRKQIDLLKKKVSDIGNINIELNMVSETSIYHSDVLITDWSAISYEYAFGTERPVLFINVPCKINNPDYMGLGIEPIEFTVRGQLGKEIEVRDISSLLRIIDDLFYNRENYRQQIIYYRSLCISNWLNSAHVGGDYLIKCCTEPVLFNRRS